MTRRNCDYLLVQLVGMLRHLGVASDKDYMAYYQMAWYNHVKANL